MKCPACGKENPDRTGFCQRCGVLLISPTDQEQKTAGGPAASFGAAAKPETREPAKRMSIKGFIFAVIAAVIVFAAGKVVATGMNSSSGADISSKTASITQYYKPGREIYGLLKNGADTGETIVSGWDHLYPDGSSLDGSVAAFTDWYKNILYIYIGAKMQVVEDAYSYVMSSDGTRLAVIDQDGALTYYNCFNWRKARVADNVSEKGLTMSPNGSALTYTVYDSDRDEYVSYVFKGGSSRQLGRQLVPIGIADMEKYIYCINYDDNGLYVLNSKGKSTKLADDVGSEFLFNRDLSQLIFSSEDSVYVTVSGKEKVRLSGSDMYLRLASPAASMSRDQTGSYYYYSYDITTYGVSSLAGKFYAADGDRLIYINKKWEPVMVADGISSSVFAISKDGGAICYVRNGQLYKVTAKTVSDPVFIADGAAAVQLTSDGKDVYYVDDSGVLWYKSGKKEPVRVADGVDPSIVITSDDHLLFLADCSSDSGVLYSVKDGGKKKKISDDAYDLRVDGDVAYYMSGRSGNDQTGDLYAAVKKDEFRLAVSKVIR